MRSLRIALLLSLGLLVGCAGSAADDASATTSAVTSETTSEVAGAFSIDYTIGWFSGAKFESIDAKKLGSVLPDGDAQTYAKCLAARRGGAPLGDGRADTVRGDTLDGEIWKHDGATYYVLTVDLEDAEGLHDVAMAFVFSSDGASRFQALTWDGKRNVKIAYKTNPPCTSS